MFLRLALLLVLLLGSCGDGSGEPSPTTPAPGARTINEEPKALLTGQRVDEDPRARLTRQLRDALQERDLDAAGAALNALDEGHAGQGRGTDGEPVNLLLYREALVASLVDQAFAKIDGPQEAGPRWNRGWVLAACAARGYYCESDPEFDPELDPDLEARLAGLVRYGELWSLDESGLKLPAHEGPQIVVLVDHFALGEAVLEGMLRRWQREHKAQRLRVGIVPITGRGVRVGIRRVPATPDGERAAIQKQADALGLHVLETSTDPVEWLQQHGLSADHNILLLFNEKGLLAGRLAGRILDPTAFEEAVQRLVTR